MCRPSHSMSAFAMLATTRRDEMGGKADYRRLLSPSHEKDIDRRTPSRPMHSCAHEKWGAATWDRQKTPPIRGNLFLKHLAKTKMLPFLKPCRKPAHPFHTSALVACPKAKTSAPASAHVSSRPLAPHSLPRLTRRNCARCTAGRQTDRPTDIPTARSAGRLSDQPPSRTRDNPSARPADRPAGRLTDRQIHCPTVRHRPTDRPPDHPAARLTAHQADRPADHPTDGRAADRPTIRPPARPTDHTAGRSIDGPRPTARPPDNSEADSTAGVTSSGRMLAVRHATS